MVNIANPIYDSVFKYLMEDERIAKTLISALLKKEVVDVDMRRNEYTNGTRDRISMFLDYDGNHVTKGIRKPGYGYLAEGQENCYPANANVFNGKSYA